MYNAVTSVSVTGSVKKTVVRTLSWIQLVWLSYGRQIACEAEESQVKTNTLSLNKILFGSENVLGFM